MSFVRQAASATDNSDHTSNDPSGTVTLAYSDNTFRASLYGDVGYSGLSGADQVTRQGTVGISLADQFTQRWSWSLGGNYQVSRTVFAATSSDVKTLNGTGSIRYAPWEWGAFDLTGYFHAGTVGRSERGSDPLFRRPRVYPGENLHRILRESDAPSPRHAAAGVPGDLPAQEVAASSSRSCSSSSGRASTASSPRRRFKSSTTILVVPQRVPEELRAKARSASGSRTGSARSSSRS